MQMTLKFADKTFTRAINYYPNLDSKINPSKRNALGASSHTGLRARDRYTSSTLVGGKGGAGPSLLPTSLEGPTEYVNARWM